MNPGYMGMILMVDLSKGEFLEENVPDEVYEKYLSGLGPRCLHPVREGTRRR